MLFDKLKMAAVVLSGLFLLGFGALVAAQQATGNGATDRPRDTAIAERNDFAFDIAALRLRPITTRRR